MSPDELHDKANKPITPIAENDAKQIRPKIQVLLLTANNNEYHAVLSFLDPIDGRKTLLKDTFATKDGFISDDAVYIYGQYGAFVAAVQILRTQGPAEAKNAISIANKCFGEHLHAIFAVGVACGMEKNNLLDVLVSERVSLYDAARIGTDGDTKKYEITQRAERNIPTSKFFINQFKQNNWVKSSKMVNDLKCSTKFAPKQCSGNILSGSYLIDNKKVKTKLSETFDPEAIGIEMEAAGLYRDYIDGKCRLQIMIVKGVCDFGDGNKSKQYQPTAAMLAADCVKHYLNDKTLPDALARFQGFGKLI